MRVPGDALAGDLAVLAEIVEGVAVGGGIVFLIGEDGGLFGGFIFDAETAVQDGEDVVSGEIVGIDGLDDLVLGASLRIFVLLVEREAEFAVGVAGARERLGDEAQIGDSAVEIALVALRGERGSRVRGSCWERV